MEKPLRLLWILPPTTFRNGEHLKGTIDPLAHSGPSIERVGSPCSDTRTSQARAERLVYYNAFDEYTFHHGGTVFLLYQRTVGYVSVHAAGMIQQPKEYLPLKQMLQDFSCFRDDAAYEVEVTNSNHIADQIKLVFPSCGAYPQFTLPMPWRSCLASVGGNLRCLRCK